MSNLQYCQVNEDQTTQSDDKASGKVVFASTYSDLLFREKAARLRLAPGSYCIIPSTYDPDLELPFMLRVATEKPATIR